MSSTGDKPYRFPCDMFLILVVCIGLWNQCLLFMYYTNYLWFCGITQTCKPWHKLSLVQFSQNPKSLCWWSLCLPPDPYSGCTFRATSRVGLSALSCEFGSQKGRKVPNSQTWKSSFYSCVMKHLCFLFVLSYSLGNKLGVVWFVGFFFPV